ncbi:hypothetical protein [Haliscomenobacter hydrossis]|uniref:Uncharacterized protein n=1 Tax=Haliscomenobacter hydrossis (strain ATCC 27775 / DSM 1100 / LMG 10767 / O) TaxID=760192 RepID=F4KQK0_HALH1|nr:hypothetical protein [Haliscomenobacter hydrossis]AEE49989.1 hypothetical protein Halhy_2104 [Haliscomenobacter hydrossis DSM 1100]
MKDLIDLVQIVTRPKLRSIELIGDGHNGKSKLSIFYDKIVDGQFHDDDAAAQALYHANKQSPMYKKLKKNLKDRLINALFLIDVKQASYTDRQKAYYECYKDWAAAKILFGKNAYGVALNIATKLLKITRKYEFTELTVDICHSLRLYHGTIDGDYNKYELYNQELKENETIWILENRAEEYYIDLSIGTIHSKASKADFQTKAKGYYAALEEALQTYNTYHLHLYGRLIESYIHSSVNDQPRILDVCNRAIAFFNEKEYVAAVPLQVFNYQKAVCQAQLHQFPEAIQTLDQCIQYVSKGHFNWYKAQELILIVHLHQGEYDQGSILLQSVLSSENYKNLPDHIKESWRIADAYLSALKKMNKLKSTTNGIPTPDKFKLSKFLNEMPLYSKDKQGLNLHILILEMLFYLIDKDHGKLQARAEAIDKYRIRYLRNEGLKRSNYLFKLFLAIPKAQFDKTEILQRTQADFQLLCATPIALSKQTLEVEILPYETLWSFVLELMDLWQRERLRSKSRK